MDLIIGGGKMGELIRSADWSQTSLASSQQWPESLRYALSICLNSGFPIAIYWGEEFILLYNDAWSSIPGDKHPWALGKPGQAVWPEIWHLIEEQFKSVYVKAESIRSPDTLLPMKRFGYTEECYFDYTLSPIIDTDGNVQGVFNAVVETTYKVINDRRNNILQKLIREAQRADSNNNVYQTIGEIIDSAKPDIAFCVLYIKGTDGQVLLARNAGIDLKQLEDINWPFQACFGPERKTLVVSVDEYLKEPFYTDWPEPCKEACLLPLSLQHADACLVIGVNPGKRFDDDYQMFLESFAHSVSTTMNISLKSVEEQLAKEDVERRERQFRQLADSMPQMVWVTDAEGYHEYYNQRWYDFTATDFEETKGEGWSNVFHPDDQEMAWNRWLHSLRTGETYEIEYRLKNGKTGNYHWVLGRAVPVYNDEGQIEKWFGTCTDINEQKLIQQQKDDFVGIASHELKTPLTSIKAFNQILLKSIKSDDKIYSIAKRTAVQISRLQYLISDLLDVTKINAGKIAYNFSDFNFKSLVLDAVETIQHTTSTHNIVLDRIDDIDYTGDKIRLEQVIANFLSNAIKYSPEADKVIVRTEVQDQNIIFSVTDFGIGIKKENLSRLFDRYYRVDNTSSMYEGLGLGLYISSEILKRHNGSFWIESEVGKGSTFYFRLPISERKEFTETSGLYFRNTYLEIRYVESIKTLMVDWTGFQTFESVRNGCMVMLDLLKKNKASKVLNDNRKIKGTWSEAANWLGEKWFPMMEEAGLKYFAWIYSPSKFSQLSTDKTLEVQSGNVITRSFHTEEEAMTWLREQN